jgi:hypothetical protein
MIHWPLVLPKLILAVVRCPPWTITRAAIHDGETIAGAKSKGFLPVECNSIKRAQGKQAVAEIGTAKVLNPRFIE